MFDALKILENLQPDHVGTAEINGLVNNGRTTSVLKVPQSIFVFNELIQYYGTRELLNHILKNKFSSFEEMKKTLSAKIQRSEWLNIGGQLIQKTEVDKLKRNIKN